MRTLAAGLRALIDAPMALAPMAAAGLVAAVLVAFGVFPANGASAASAAAFPMDVFFDLKQSIAFAPSWAAFAAAAILSVGVRSGVMAATLWLADGAPGPFLTSWAACARLGLRAAVTLFPAAAMFFIGSATRYAPFVWVAGLLAVWPALSAARGAARLDVGGGAPPGRGVPEAPAYLAYAYLVSLVAAAMSVLADAGSIVPALIVATSGPLHALFLLGWHNHTRSETYPGGGAFASAITLVAVLGLLGASVFDRYLRESPPVARAEGEGTLFLVGGVDSTSHSGALVDLDPRDVGFAPARTRLLSYAEDSDAYRALDTRRDLDDVADAMAGQMTGAPNPWVLLGHSQAAVIVDRMLARSTGEMERAVVLAPSPPRPPAVTTPEPGRDGPGRVGADLARAFAGLMEVAGLQPIDVDAPANPTNLAAIPTDQATPRVAVWALGDSVWLEGDWRRPGEINLVALTDHVGVTNDERSLAAARSFLTGGEVGSDDRSWRGALVGVLRFAFEPWRPR